ncbi:hypothetical protein SAY86_007306 [Trapa natans]|uniref:Uncharacterized protein n=1 Tax=Trapa natans TaxID=22666 RepID=A0AAN7LNH0_TRANT|nr:hypothetical protein SAY86_007306 [Trapa natans]
MSKKSPPTGYKPVAGFIPSHKRNSQREAKEAIERLPLHEKRAPQMSPIVPNAKVFDFPRSKDRQFDQETVKDHLIPFKGYAKEANCNIWCVKRILKHFYSSCTCSGLLGITRGADLMEACLATVVADIDLNLNKFVSFA